MKKALVFVALIVAIVLVVPRALDRVQTGLAEDEARRRVVMILAAMAEEPADEQTAVCLWMADTLVLPRDRLERAWDEWYPIWRSLPLAEAEGWEVASLEPGESGTGWNVTVTKGRQSLLLHVVAKEPIRVLD